MNTETFLVLVKFAFPFKIAIPSGSSFWIRKGEECTSVRVVAADGLRIVIYGSDSEELDESVSDRSWYRAVHPKDDDKIPNRVIAVRDDPEHFVEKVIDHVAYTFLEVAFEIPGPNPREDNGRVGEIVASALGVFVTS